MNVQRFYTTGEIAKILGVAPRTVCLLIDRGRLKAHRVPTGSQYHHRRVAAADLERFLLEWRVSSNGNAVTILDELAEACKALLDVICGNCYSVESDYKKECGIDCQCHCHKARQLAGEVLSRLEEKTVRPAV